MVRRSGQQGVQILDIGGKIIIGSSGISVVDAL
jgi:hypothetical protein